MEKDMAIRFGIGGCFKCSACGKRSREVGCGNAGVGLCPGCFDRTMKQNEHPGYGNGHPAPGPLKGCPVCEAANPALPGKVVFFWKR
jgi:hypothetical protein